MPRRKKEEVLETEITEELSEEEVEPYDLNPPCQFEMSKKQFDAEKMRGYEWQIGGRFWLGGEEILVVEVYK